MRLVPVLLVALLATSSYAQESVFPLESVTIDGSTVSKDAILEIGGLRLGSAIDKAGIEEACKRLQESGLFAAINYRYAPGPNKGYAVTLSLTDQSRLAAAAIDLPGVDEEEVWRWLGARFPSLKKQAPEAGAAQQFLAREIQQYAGAKLRGQKVTPRLESDLITRQMTISFQPETLPRIRSVSFSGNRSVAAAELSAALDRVLADKGYTPRSFASAVELNLRPVYEEHGLYRAQFAPGGPEWSGGDVALTVGITEGPAYQFGKVDVSGDALPVQKMLAEAKLPAGKLANWKQIQNGVWEMEKVVKRTGFFEASAVTERSFDDAARTLNLRVQVSKGPLFRFGQVRTSGLGPDLQKEALRLWRPKTGDPYDYAYASDFFQAFSRVLDFGRLQKWEAETKPGAGDHVVDITLVFVPR